MSAPAARQRLDARERYSPIVTSRDQVGLLTTVVVFDVVYTFVVRVEGVVGCMGAKGPHLDCAVQAGRCESVGVFGVEGEVHDVVRVTLEGLMRCSGKDLPSAGAATLDDV